jgi:hypothetical protein
VKNDVALIDQLSCYLLVVNAVDCVIEARVVFQVANVLETAGRKIVDDENFVAAF